MDDPRSGFAQRSYAERFLTQRRKALPRVQGFFFAPLRLCARKISSYTEPWINLHFLCKASGAEVSRGFLCATSVSSVSLWWTGSRANLTTEHTEVAQRNQVRTLPDLPLS